MCRLSSEVFVAAGGGSALATVATFVKVHWDAIRDRKAFENAKTERGRTINNPLNSPNGAIGNSCGGCARSDSSESPTSHCPT